MKFLKFFLSSLYQFIRSQLGTRNVCIHTVSCSEFAKITFKNKPLIIALPIVCLRLLSCNPITAIFLKIKYKIALKNLK